jgi:hypothetical protein
MEITLTGCTLTEIASNYATLSVGILKILHLQGVSGTGGLRDLSGQG